LEEASKYYGEDIGSLKIVSDGKPYLYKHPDFYFNISHSRSLLAVAVSNGNIGIDCEEISKIRNVIVEKRFTIVEKEYICESGENFTNIWTRKEAYFKFTGEGILGNFQAVDTLSPPYSDLLSTKKYGNYIVSLCCENPVEAKVEVINENDIIQIKL
jgi:4'-phosphopantetheinyl transferase